MPPTQTMINGLPGNVASIIAAHALQDDRIALVPYSLTGPEIEGDRCTVAGTDVELIKPDERDVRMDTLVKAYGSFITVDYTHPLAVNDNAAFYCRRTLPFVMGTTGGDRERLHQTVADSSICAVIAPNMAKQIVGFQAMLEYAADTFPGIFSGYALSVRESHQAGKADTSGTAKAVVGCFNRMGIDFAPSDIVMERDPHVQQQQWGIPPEHLSGHGWHTYRLTSKDKSVTFEFQHNINGRDVYADGTLDAIRFLQAKINAGCTGRVFTMIDVLQS